MRGKLPAALLGLCVLGQGCAPLANTARTLICEPVEYSRALEACVDEKRAKELADAAWAAYLEAHRDAHCSCDFGQGFKDGYADYLFAGGTGEPPPLAPRWYWRAENKTPAGRAGEQDWFQGFRTGAAAAKVSGFREIETVGTWTALRRTPDDPDAGAAYSVPASPALLPPPRPVAMPPSKDSAAEPVPPPDISRFLYPFFPSVSKGSAVELGPPAAADRLTAGGDEPAPTVTVASGRPGGR